MLRTVQGVQAETDGVWEASLCWLHPLQLVPHFLQAADCDSSCHRLREGLLEAQGWPPDLSLWLASPSLCLSGGTLKGP